MLVQGKIESGLQAIRAAFTGSTAWTGQQYSWFRVVFGTYLLVHFIQLVPYAVELFSSEGMLGDATVSPFTQAFPNILAAHDSPIFATVFVMTGAVLCIPFILGRWDRSSALMLWYVWACLFGRNPLISNPGLPYVGLLLMVHAMLPPGSRGISAGPKGPDHLSTWRMPRGFFTVVWILMAVGYSYSGLIKLGSPSWLDGTALTHVLNNPLARGGWPGDLLLAGPEWFLKSLTWGALGFEILFAPLALWGRARPYLWAGMLTMHLGLIVLIDFADLSLGMVMLHLFTFDPKWVGGWVRATERIPRRGCSHRLGTGASSPVQG